MEIEYQSSQASLFTVHAREPRKHPEFCLDMLMETFDGTTGEIIGILYGEKGYCKTTYGRQTQKWLVDQNARMGIDEATFEAFGICSVFGTWDQLDNVIFKIRNRKGA
jgi:hypothetical protein